jgi:hypothetical protein
MIITNKSIIDKNEETTMPMVLLFIHSGTEAVLAVAHIHIAIYNKRKINPEYENVLS